MTDDPRDPGPTGQRRPVIVVAGVVLIAAAVAGTVLYRTSDGEGDDPAAVPLTVVWGGSEGHPSCLYHPEEHTVDARIRIDGDASRRHEVTVTVTAYADENTSKPVGSSSRSVQVEGMVSMRFVITIPVEKTPHVDEDGIAACRLAVT